MTGASLAGTWGTRERRRHLSGADQAPADQIPADQIPAAGPGGVSP